MRDPPSSPVVSNAGGIPVVLAAAVEELVSTPLEAVGTAMAREAVQVTSRIADTVSRIAFAEGDLVSRGMVLVELDATEANAELAGAEARLAAARRQYERGIDLAARKVLSTAELDQITTALRIVEAEAAAARARRANTVIRAPFAGRTGFRRVSVGALVSPGTVITTFDDSSLIKLEFSVAESQIHVVETGLEVTARTPGLPGRKFTGRITTLDARVDPVSRSLRVRAELPNKDGQLRPGMFMSVQLQGRAARALVVPEASIVPEQGKVFVFLVDARNIARRHEVQIGSRRPGQVEVTRGLAAGDNVIVDGTQLVNDGSSVRPVAIQDNASTLKERTGAYR